MLAPPSFGFRVPRSVIEFEAAVQRKAWMFGPRIGVPITLCPTTTFPSAETPQASLPTDPPGRSPRPTSPSSAVQRKASLTKPVLFPMPTTTDPSAETPRARLS